MSVCLVQIIARNREFLHKWKNQKYHLCPPWQQLNPQQPRTQRPHGALTVTELMESVGVTKKLKSGAEVKTGEPKYRSL